VCNYVITYTLINCLLTILFFVYLLRHHQIVVVVFPDVYTASAASSDPDMYHNRITSPNDAYTRVTNGEVGVAFVAIELDDSDWPSDGMFTIGADTTSATSSNQPLRTGFAYRAFIIAYPLNV